MTGILDRIGRWLRRSEQTVERDAEGVEPVATPPDGEQRETSTNAQTEGASGEPWPGNN